MIDEGFLQDRHQVLGALREERPVCQAIMPDGLRVWLVTRYADARAALTHPALSKSTDGAAPIYERQEREGLRRQVLPDVLRYHMLNMDPPEHTRLRKLVTKAFTVRRVEALRPSITTIADDLLNGVAGKNRINLLDEYAFPLSAWVIGELFGIPDAERPEFGELAHAIGFGTDPEAPDRMARLLARLIAYRRIRPGDDLLTGLIQARDGQDQINETELVSMAFLLLSAGYLSTGHLVGNAVFHLLAQPDRLATLRGDPARTSSALEELLRFCGPTSTATLRYTLQPLTLSEVEVPAGELVLIVLGSANRDENWMDGANRLDLDRDTAVHLAFGHGIHHCLGAQLARLEGQIAITRLSERFPDLALAVPPSELRWTPSTLFYGLRSLPVTLSQELSATTSHRVK